eukprot:14908409-Ditylum_brightwellii.AAC.1
MRNILVAICAIVFTNGATGLTITTSVVSRLRYDTVFTSACPYVVIVTKIIINACQDLPKRRDVAFKSSVPNQNYTQEKIMFRPRSLLSQRASHQSNREEININYHTEFLKLKETSGNIYEKMWIKHPQ